MQHVCSELLAKPLEQYRVLTSADLARVKAERLRVSRDIRQRLLHEENAMSIAQSQSHSKEVPLRHSRSGSLGYVNSYYDQLKDRSGDVYRRYYDPQPAKHDQVRLALEAFGYEAERADLGIPTEHETVADEGFVPGVAGVVDWNERFQATIQKIRSLHINANDQERARLYEDIVQLERDFLYCSETYGKIIISEYYLPDEHKTIKPAQCGGFAGGDKYIVHSILFKLAIDSQRLFGPSDAAAAKIGGHELKGLVNHWNCNVDVALPLMALVDYRGFRIIAMSILPIAEDTLVMGSADAGRTVRNACSELTGKLVRVARQLNLQPHVCGTREGHTELLNSATDLEGHIGRVHASTGLCEWNLTPSGRPPLYSRLCSYLPARGAQPQVRPWLPLPPVAARICPPVFASALPGCL